MLGIQLQWGRGSLAAACASERTRRQITLASMGPRLISRGVVPDACQTPEARSLQWGRGVGCWCCAGRADESRFNGAAAH